MVYQTFISLKNFPQLYFAASTYYGSLFNNFNFILHALNRKVLHVTKSM